MNPTRYVVRQIKAGFAVHAAGCKAAGRYPMPIDADDIADARARGFKVVFCKCTHQPTNGH